MSYNPSGRYSVGVCDVQYLDESSSGTTGIDADKVQSSACICIHRDLLPSDTWNVSVTTSVKRLAPVLCLQHLVGRIFYPCNREVTAGKAFKKASWLPSWEYARGTQLSQSLSVMFSYLILTCSELGNHGQGAPSRSSHHRIASIQLGLGSERLLAAHKPCVIPAPINFASDMHCRLRGVSDRLGQAVPGKDPFEACHHPQQLLAGAPGSCRQLPGVQIPPVLP